MGTKFNNGPDGEPDSNDENEGWIAVIAIALVVGLGLLWIALENSAASDDTDTESIATSDEIDFSDTDDSFVPPEQAMEARQRREARENPGFPDQQRESYREKYEPEIQRARREGLDYEGPNSVSTDTERALQKELNLDRAWRQPSNSGQGEISAEDMVPEEAREYLDQ